tara:strand:+ start:31 stop:624 length:594 start_codon:yes stop_codon:yes gene_type:complete
MTPLPLGILALAGVTGGGGAYELLETTTLSTSASSITFSGLDTLAAGYQHLQIRYTARGVDSTSTVTNNGFNFYINADTGSSYTYHRLKGSGSAVSAFGSSSPFTSGIAGRLLSSGATAGAFSSGVVDILDFNSVSKFKTIRTLSGHVDPAVSSANVITLDSVAWLNTDAITSLLFKVQTGSADFAAFSRLSLYGVK